MQKQQSGVGNAPSHVRQRARPLQQKNTDEDAAVTKAPPGAIDLLSPRSRTRQAPTQTDLYADVEEDDTDYDAWPGRLPSSARRYPTTSRPQAPLPPGEYIVNGRRVIVEEPHIVPRRRTATSPEAGYTTERRPISEEKEPRRKVTQARPGRRIHWVLILGVGMLLMLALWQGFTWLGNWWTMHQQDAAFGRPRTYQFDSVVGHNDSQTAPTHFILINLNRKVEIYEEPGGDASKTIIYPGPTLYGDGQDLTPILGKVYDLLGNGKQDLIIYIQDQRIIYLNDGTKFVPATPDQVQRIHYIPPPPSP